MLPFGLSRDFTKMLAAVAVSFRRNEIDSLVFLLVKNRWKMTLHPLFEKKQVL